MLVCSVCLEHMPVGGKADCERQFPLLQHNVITQPHHCLSLCSGKGQGPASLGSMPTADAEAESQQGSQRSQETEKLGNPRSDLKFNITHETESAAQDRLVQSLSMNSCPLCKTRSLLQAVSHAPRGGRQTQLTTESEHPARPCRSSPMLLCNCV